MINYRSLQSHYSNSIGWEGRRRLYNSRLRVCHSCEIQNYYFRCTSCRSPRTWDCVDTCLLHLRTRDSITLARVQKVRVKCFHTTVGYRGFLIVCTRNLFDNKDSTKMKNELVLRTVQSEDWKTHHESSVVWVTRPPARIVNLRVEARDRLGYKLSVRARRKNNCSPRTWDWVDTCLPHLRTLWIVLFGSLSAGHRIFLGSGFPRAWQLISLRFCLTLFLRFCFKKIELIVRDSLHDDGHHVKNLPQCSRLCTGIQIWLWVFTRLWDAHGLSKRHWKPVHSPFQHPLPQRALSVWNLHFSIVFRVLDGHESFNLCLLTLRRYCQIEKFGEWFYVVLDVVSLLVEVVHAQICQVFFEVILGCWRGRRWSLYRQVMRNEFMLCCWWKPVWVSKKAILHFALILDDTLSRWSSQILISSNKF